jgi:hypothetical protein
LEAPAAYLNARQVTSRESLGDELSGYASKG